MKSLLSVLVLIILASTSLHAQDIMFYRSGNTMKVQIIEVGKNKIRYYDWGNKRERVYAVPVKDIASIQYANGRIQSFDLSKTEKAQVDSFGRNLKIWSFDFGGSSILSTVSIPKWKSGYMIGIGHQFGYQISNYVNLAIGGEFDYLSSSTDTVTDPKKYSNTVYSIAYIGIPLSLNIVELGKRSGICVSGTISVGARYCNQIVSQSLGFGTKCSLFAGCGFRSGRTYLQIGPYVDYIGMGANYNGIGYGLRLNTLR